MYDLELTGCSSTPLMAYLKALGVFRLVAEMADGNAKLTWRQGTARLYSRLNRVALAEFFLREYRPTPILAPWNGGSGFYGGGAAPVDAIGQSTSSRFEGYRRAIDQVRAFVPAEKPEDDAKLALLDRCRNELDDQVVPWLDACYVLGVSSASFFPLLGTGGNDGRLDFTSNFLQRLADVLALDENAPPPRASEGWLASALFRDSLEPLQKSAIGQFHPGGIGGANGVQGDFEAEARVNPWDYVLMLEGSLLFAGAAVRRFGQASSRQAAFPFCVQSVAVGYGSATASEETTDGSKAELWLPLWDAPASLGEVAKLFSEGRAQLKRSQARNAVEFALAASLLGVSRGVRAFVRYGFHKRNGKSFLATPLGRFVVTPRPKASLLLDPAFRRWHDRLRIACGDKSRTPARYQTALRTIDQSLFEFANRCDRGDLSDRAALARVLIAIGRAERTLSHGIAFCEGKDIRPLSGLSSQWFDDADDGSVEFRLAASLAGVRGLNDSRVGPFRTYLEPVSRHGAGYRWDRSSVSQVWSNQPFEANLAAVFERRQMEAYQDNSSQPLISSFRDASASDVLEFLEGNVDEERLHDFLWGLCAVVNDGETEGGSGTDWNRKRGEPLVNVPFEFGLLRLLAGRVSLLLDHGRWVLSNQGRQLFPEPAVFSVLRSEGPGRTETAVERAALRYRAASFPIFGTRNRQRTRTSRTPSSRFCPLRILAALQFPLAKTDLERIANTVLYPLESQE